MSKRIRIIRPASRESGNLLVDRLKELEAVGFEVAYDETLPDPSWPYVASPVASRLKALQQALAENKTEIIWCARGGYGVSDLLPLLDWNQLEKIAPKLIIGFSDISALHSAFYTRLGWQGLHAPMPATTLWGKDAVRSDIDELLRILGSDERSSTLPVTPVKAAQASGAVAGKLFGGCFSVLTNLIGTPYFPKPEDIEILFLEDTDENPGRLMRYLNQWQQSGALAHTRAVVLGDFRNCCSNPGDVSLHVHEQFVRRLKVPVFRSRWFGHTCPNFPLMVGARAEILKDTLTWSAQGRVVA